MNPTNDIRDIKGLVPVPHSWWWLWVLLAVVLVGAVAWWFWKRRQRVTTEVTAIPPSPFEIALAALQRLRQDSPPVEQFYIRLSDIVRQYIEGQFGLHAPERTTEEFLAQASLPAEHMASLCAFLQESDLVKFARLQPAVADQQRAFEAAETFVRETRS